MPGEGREHGGFPPWRKQPHEATCARRRRMKRRRGSPVKYRTVKLFDSTKIPLLSKALDAYTLRHRAISSNIANIGSAGYRPSVVSFEDQLAATRAGGGVAVTTTDPRHIAVGADTPADVTPVITDVAPDPRMPYDPDASGVNGVDIDNEMAELAKNQIRFKYAARLIAGTFHDIQESIRGGT